MKKQSDLSRLMGYAGNYRYFTYASWALSAASALVALVPFVYIWKILREAPPTAAPEPALPRAVHLFKRKGAPPKAAVLLKII